MQDMLQCVGGAQRSQRLQEALNFILEPFPQVLVPEAVRKAVDRAIETGEQADFDKACLKIQLLRPEQGIVKNVTQACNDQGDVQRGLQLQARATVLCRKVLEWRSA